MLRIKFYLKRPKPGKNAEKHTKEKYKSNPDAPTSIYALINYVGNSLKIYTSESIRPSFWNAETNTARNTPKFPEHPEFNIRLDKIRSTINKVFMDYRNDHDHNVPAPAILKPLIEAAFKRNAARITFLEYFENFVNRSFAGERIDPKKGKAIRHAVAKGYKTTLNHLKEFAKTDKRKLDFDTVDLIFHADFTKYLKAAPRLLSDNTVGINFQRIKAVMAEATERGINSNLTFKSKYFVKQSEEADTIYLNVEELQAIQDHDLRDSERLDNVRDLFLIGCYTGLRFSDFSILQPKNIKDGYIRIRQVKTGGEVTIPVHPVVKKILNKRKGELPRSITNIKLNEYLKELGSKIDIFKKTETKSITKGGVKVISSVPKWKLITTHTARRSFATNEYNAGTPSITIMAITGHKSERSFMKYIRVTPDEHAQKIKQLWDKRNRRLKAV